MASLTPGAGGSISPTSPANSRWFSATRRACVTAPEASAMTRRPPAAIERLTSSASPSVAGAAHLQDPLGRALDAGNQLAAPLMERRHEAADRSRRE